MYYKGEKISRPATCNVDFHGYGERIRKVLGDRISRKKKLYVLDIGTGFGAVAAFLSQHLSKESKLWTADPSEEMLEGAKAKLSQEGLDKRIPIEFIRADAEELDFDDGYFDVIVSIMVLHHVADLNAVLKELLRVLKKGGQLLLVDYDPKASKELDFHARHSESDFFDPRVVAKSIKELGAKDVKLKSAKMWYLIEASK